MLISHFKMNLKQKIHGTFPLLDFFKRKIWTASRVCVSSLRRARANLWIVPVLVCSRSKHNPFAFFEENIPFMEPFYNKTLKTMSCVDQGVLKLPI